MADALTDLIASERPDRLASGFAFTEGPLWHPEGHWLFVDIPRERVQRLLADGTVETVREESGGANGLTFDLERRLVMCEGGRIFADPPGDEYRRLTRLETDGSIAVLAERFEGARLNRPNDVVCHSDGTGVSTSRTRTCGSNPRSGIDAGLHRRHADAEPDGDLGVRPARAQQIDHARIRVGEGAFFAAALDHMRPNRPQERS